MHTRPLDRTVTQFYDSLATFLQIIFGDNIHFGYLADPTDEHLTMHQSQEALTDLLIAKLNVQPGQHMLDVGCGVGHPAIRLAQATGAQVTGITISPVQQRLATERVHAAGLTNRVRCELVDAMAMPYAPATFDMAWAIESVVHMPSWKQMFQEVVRVMRPGGRVMVVDMVLSHPLSAEQSEVISALFNIERVGFLEEYIGAMKAAGMVNIVCHDVTANVWRPFHRRALARMHDAKIVAKVREHYDLATIQTFRESWQVLTDAGDRFFYVVLIGECPPARG